MLLTLLQNSSSGNYVLPADGGVYSYSGNDATLIYTTAGAFSLAADGGTYSYSGNDAALRFNRVLAADGGVYSYTGNDATLTYTPVSGAFVLQADGGVYTYAGDNANLLYSGTPVIPQIRGGDDAPRRRKQREFEDERSERGRLKELIAKVVDGVSDTPAVQVVTQEAGEGVVLVPRGAPAVAIPVPPAFDVEEVARMISQALTEAGVRIREARSAAARERLAREVERAMVQLRRRRREEEILLLMD
jgi:hypothetical protein